MMILSRNKTAIIGYSVMLSLIVSACSTPDSEAQVSDLVGQFIKEYDVWAQNGFSGEIPEPLKDISSTSVHQKLNLDGEFYNEAGLVQQGEMTLVDLNVVSFTESSAEVVATMDSSEITTTVKGNPVATDDQKVRTLKMVLHKEADWIISDLVPLENSN